MSEGQQIFQWVCKQPDEKEAVASLDLAGFRLLGGWLARRGEINGLPGHIWGVCLAEAFRRLVDTKGQRKKVEEALG